MSKQPEFAFVSLGADGDVAFKRARRSDPDTSHEAAAKVNFAGEHHRKILAMLGGYGPPGATSEQLSRAGVLSYHAVARRMRELERAGRVEDSGERRPTRTGRRAIVWKLR